MSINIWTETGLVFYHNEFVMKFRLSAFIQRVEQKDVRNTISSFQGLRRHWTNETSESNCWNAFSGTDSLKCWIHGHHQTRASSFVMLCLHCSSFQSLFVCEPKSSANETLSWVKISWLTWPWLRLYVLCPSVLGNAVQSFSSIWADLLYITISLLSYELCVFNVCSETAAVFVSSSSVACCCPAWESSTTA